MNKYLLMTLLQFLLFRLGAQTIQHTEMLGRPTDKSITVQLFFNDSVEMAVQYGLLSGTYPNQSSWQIFEDSVPAEITLSNLIPDKKYFYRVLYRKPGQSVHNTRPEFTFQTQRSVGSEFSFVVQADPHMDAMTDTALYRLCLKNQLNDAPDFMIDLGDFLMSDKLQNSSKIIPRDTVTYRCNLLHTYYETSSHSIPLFIALGNHEGESGWYQNGTANNVAIWGSIDRKKYFMNPAPDNFYSGDTTHAPYVGQRENYYTWQWGDAQFIVLDPYWYTNPKPDSLNGWRWSLGKTQYDWLKRTLEHSTAKFKFVFAHQIIGGDPEGRGGVEFANRYEWGGENLDGTKGFAVHRPGWYKPIKDLLEENRVTIFFHGHDHFFGKQELNCLVYQETPQPSLPNFMNANQAADYGYIQGQILPNAGHLRVHVAPDGIKLDYVRAYLPKNETPTRHNGDVSASYFIGSTNCYDSLSTGIPIIWNSDYADELVYPNPFNEETKIAFEVNNRESISLTIYSSNGQKVRTLMNDQDMPIGKYQIIWDGKDGNGSHLPDGTYFYFLKGQKTAHQSGKITIQAIH